MDEKLVKITDTLSIHLPADISPAAEAEIIAMIRKDLDEPERVEAEFKELLRLEAEGKLLSFEDVLADLGIERPNAGGEHP